jgi:hypothetical protein
MGMVLQLLAYRVGGGPIGLNTNGFVTGIDVNRGHADADAIILVDKKTAAAGK